MISGGFTLDPFDTVREIIKSWEPKGCTTEKDFEKSLYDKLREKLKNQKIQRQYGSGEQKVDIVVDDKVPIELKKDIKNTADLQRTIGQLEMYLNRGHWTGVILVLCGDIAPEHFKFLEKYAERKKNIIAEIFPETGIFIIKK